MRIWLFFIVLTAFSLRAAAQRPDTVKVENKKDSLNRVKDSLTSKPFKPKVRDPKREYHPDSTHSPHKAFIRSLILPGWGQVYNHEWYYIPVYYTGFYLLFKAIQYNSHYYHIYLAEAKWEQAGNTPHTGYEGYGYQELFDAALSTQRNFQLSILGFAGAWGINAIQAYIGAKFIHSYTVDNNLSMRILPEMMMNPMYASNNSLFIPSLKLTLAIK